MFVCLLLYVRLGYDRYIGYRVARQGYTRDRLDHPRYRPADLGLKCSVDTLRESSGLCYKELGNSPIVCKGNVFEERESR